MKAKLLKKIRQEINYDVVMLDRKKMRMDKQGLTENEFNKYAGRIKRHVPLNDGILGKIKKVATIEQVLALHKLEKEYPPNEFDPQINIRRSLPIGVH